MERPRTPAGEGLGPTDDAEGSAQFERNLVLVAMAPQDADAEEAFAIIAEQCSLLNLHPCRLDENLGIREIILLVKRAEFLVFDLSSPSPDLYYGLGYAHGVGNEAHDILLIARTGTTLSFKVAPLRVQYYDSRQRLRDIVAASLKDMILQTRR
jgi:hypothetical protein